MTSFYSRDELLDLGFGKVGDEVFISRKASIYGAKNMEIGNHVRIDDFCVLSGKIILGDYIHISAYAGLFAGNTGILLEDFVTVSSRNVIYAESDDYSGMTMSNPMIPEKFRGVYGGQVILRKYSIVGTGCTILPDVEIKEGAAIGAMSLVDKDVEAWTINVGIPVKKLRERSKEMINKANNMVKMEGEYEIL